MTKHYWAILTASGEYSRDNWGRIMFFPTRESAFEAGVMADECLTRVPLPRAKALGFDDSLEESCC